ncbi:MAG: TolC family protein [Betaproteobacteria bacterium]|nr:TolC family protein [Betaproteobacteria bacterium]
MVHLGRNMKILCLLTAALGGCASYAPKPLSPQASAASFESRSLNDPGLKDYLRRVLPGESSQTWNLTTLTLAAFYFNPELDVARAQWDLAKAKTVTAGAIPNPTFGFSPLYNADAGSGLSPWTLGVVLGIPVETAGKRGYRVSGAEHLSEAARLDIATTAWRVRSGLRAALVNLYAAREREQLLASQQEVQARTVKALGSRLRAGEASQPEVTLARLALDQTRLAAEEAGRRRAEAQVGLAQALGLPSAAVQDLALSFDDFQKPLPKLPATDIRQQALRNRPDILAALARYAASQSALQLQIARQYPDLSIGPGYTWDQGARKWSLGVSLTLPVFNQNQGPIAEAEAGRKVAAARFTALQARVVGEIDRNYTGFTKASNKLEVANRLLAGARKQLESARARFAAGETDRLALLGAEQELTASRLARLDTLTQAQQALGSLEDAVQLPLDAAETLPGQFTERFGQDQEIVQ